MNDAASIGWLGSSISTVGYSETLWGYRSRINIDAAGQWADRYWDFTKSYPFNGGKSWPGLFQISNFISASSPLVVWDTANDDDVTHDKCSQEATIRRLLAANINQAVVIFPSWSGREADITANDPSTPANKAALENVIALCTHYGITCVNYWAELVRLVGLGATLSDYLGVGDPVHPSTLGHSVAAGLLKPYLSSLIFGAKQYTGSLPARLYDNGDYDNTPVVKTGEQSDAHAGTWTIGNGVASSSEAGATITFSATCQSFGLGTSEVLATQNQTIDYQIDGGDWVTSAGITRNGINIGARGAHAIVIRVPSGGSITIAQFLAI